MIDLGPNAQTTFTRRLGRYDVRARVGDGGMATVYAGRSLGAPGSPAAARGIVALKVIKQELSENADFVAMFLDEAEIVSRLSHPNCVHVFELGAHEGRLFIAMEFLRGQSLWDVWNAARVRGLRLPYDLVAWIGARAADGLHHAHEIKDAKGEPRQLVHRDVNHTNIFITYDGEVKIIDFGLAKATGRAVKTAAGVVKGKAAYLAPEMVAGQNVDRRADLFSLGTTLWELTTDRRLFQAGHDGATIERVYRTRVPDPQRLIDGYPSELWAILRQALARDPSDRFSTAAEMSAALDAFAKNQGRGAGAKTLADLMGGLFAAERASAENWMSDVSDPGRPAPEEPLRERTTNTAPLADEVGAQEAAPATPAPVPESPTAAAAPPDVSAAAAIAPKGKSSPLPIVLAIALLAAIVLFVVARR